MIAFGQRHRPVRFALSIAGVLVAGLAFANASEPLLHAERTFFGVYRVHLDREGRYRALTHGTTLHGMQALTGAEQGQPLTYFHRSGPFGQAFTLLPQTARPGNVAVIGLGVGTLAAYARPDQRWTFYEIDSAVERIARDQTQFNFLERCGDRCRVVIGDARLALARSAGERYDLLVLDAFSSDSIPIHLLTREALTLYLERLAPDGAILFHISNRHLALAPIVGNLAAATGLTALAQFDRTREGWVRSRFESDWVVMARKREDLGSLATDSRWQALQPSSSVPTWTDDFSNIVSVLR
jgi:spermidine synthase